MSRNKLTEDSIVRLILGQSRYRGFMSFPALRMSTGQKSARNADEERTIDLFLFHPHPSKKMHRIAFEIKLTTVDFNREVQNPIKRRAALRFSNEFFFVAAAGVISLKRLPPECGLIEVVSWVDNENVTQHHLNHEVGAPWHDNAPTWTFMAAVCRRVAKMATN